MVVVERAGVASPHTPASSNKHVRLMMLALLPAQSVERLLVIKRLGMRAYGLWSGRAGGLQSLDLGLHITTTLSIGMG